MSASPSTDRAAEATRPAYFENSFFVNGLPLSVTEPLAVALPLLSSASILSSVDLPAPDGAMGGPITANTSPRLDHRRHLPISGLRCVAFLHGPGFLPFAVTGTVYPYPSSANSISGMDVACMVCVCMDVTDTDLQAAIQTPMLQPCPKKARNPDISPYLDKAELLRKLWREAGLQHEGAIYQHHTPPR